MLKLRKEYTPEKFNERGKGHFPGLLEIRILEVTEAFIKAVMPVRDELKAPNTYLHAGSIITLADTAGGYGCFAHLPEGAVNFTTIELKCNFLGTAREGTLECIAQAVHGGKTTQVWDATVKHLETGKTIALFRCTQLILYTR